MAKQTDQLAIGLMSGTSGDGVTLALVHFKDSGLKVLHQKTYPYHTAVSKKIIRPEILTLSEISSLNFELGEIFAQCVNKFLKAVRVSPAKILVIGSHGQTLHHAPQGKPPATLQVGESAVLAERTGITVVSNFRERDIAAGGQGAPLLPYFDQYFFGNGEAKALQNIGGIANVAVVGKDLSAPLAFDTGPGNCLIDWAVQKISNGKMFYDRNGDGAKQGTVWMDVARAMGDHPYFTQTPPKSTGRELFNEKFLPSKIISNIRKRPADVLGTLTYFTAYTIAQGFRRFILPKVNVREAIISGGGLYNKTLMWHLQNLIYPVKISSIERYGMKSQSKEPAAFAFFAVRALAGKENHLPSGTGAKNKVILGKITPGKNYYEKK